VTSGLGPEGFLKKLRAVKVNADDPEVILPTDQVRRTDKYDGMVPEELLRRAYLYNEMDVPGAVKVMKRTE
jgi:ATP-dependent Lhr-like helicase